MTVFCVLCKLEISPERARRGAVTCSKEHQQEYRRQQRSERALKLCRLCGRKARRPKIAAPVPVEHMAIVESSEPLKS
jgi:hypothetical protein